MALTPKLPIVAVVTTALPFAYMFLAYMSPPNPPPPATINAPEFVLVEFVDVVTCAEITLNGFVLKIPLCNAQPEPFQIQDLVPIVQTSPGLGFWGKFKPAI